MGQSYYYYSHLLAFNLWNPLILSTFTFLYFIFFNFVPHCCTSNCCTSNHAIMNPEESNKKGNGYMRWKTDDKPNENGNCCINWPTVKIYCFKLFKAVIVATARGLFGAVSIRRKDYRNPPCLKIHGKLYEANLPVLFSLLHYLLAVVIITLSVSIGFSVHVSYNLNECSESVDCFYLNTTNGALDITDLTNCSLPFDIDVEDEENGYVQCFVDFQPAVVLALLSGYITFVPPFMFSFTHFVHSFIIFEKCLKYKIKHYILLNSILFSLPNFGMVAYTLLFTIPYNREIAMSNYSVIKFIFKDEVLGQIIAVLATFFSFLSYPWYLIGQYRQYTKDELPEKNTEYKKRTLFEVAYDKRCCRSRSNKMSIQADEPENKSNVL